MKKSLVGGFILLHLLGFTSFDTDKSKETIKNSDSFFADLAKKYAPIVRAHEDEEYPLANAAYFLQHAGLKLVNNGKETVLLQPGQVTIEALSKMSLNISGKNEPVMAQSNQDKAIDQLRLFIPERSYYNVTHARGAAPVCYAYPRYVNNQEDIDISYMFFYAYNGTPGTNISFIESLLEELGVGHHEGDWEHITVRTDKTGQHIKGVFFASHGAEEGKWHWSKSHDVDSENGFKQDRNNRLLVWSAKETHGSHNYAGTIHREPPSAFKEIIKWFGLLVERTSNDGKHYDCANMLEIFSKENPASLHPWLMFRGRWGGKAPKSRADDRGPDGPMFKDWWNKEP